MSDNGTLPPPKGGDVCYADASEIESLVQADDVGRKLPLPDSLCVVLTVLAPVHAVAVLPVQLEHVPISWGRAGGVRATTGSPRQTRNPSATLVPNDITRQGVPAMLTFGGGVHYCLGVHPARIELAEALRVITARMASPRRTGPAPWKPITELSGPTTLPIEFDAWDQVRVPRFQLS